MADTASPPSDPNETPAQASTEDPKVENESKSAEVKPPVEVKVETVAKTEYDDLVSRHKATSEEAKGYRTKNSALNTQIETLTSEKDALVKEVTDLKRANIIARYSISDEDAETFLTSDDLEQVEKIAKALVERTAKPATPPNVVRNEGRATKPVKTEEAERRKNATALFGA